jgi:hypothetical protein
VQVVYFEKSCRFATLLKTVMEGHVWEVEELVGKSWAVERTTSGLLFQMRISWMKGYFLRWATTDLTPSLRFQERMTAVTGMYFEAGPVLLLTPEEDDSRDEELEDDDEDNMGEEDDEEEAPPLVLDLGETKSEAGKELTRPGPTSAKSVR